MRLCRAVTVLILAGVWLGGCATTTELRTTDGPTAEGVWKAKFRAVNARGPNFEERQTFEEELDGRVREFLARNPQVANSVRVGNLRFLRQSKVGMTKDEIRLLLGKPQEVTDNPARMEVLARKFWPEVKPQAKEAWIYPEGWALYFDGDTLADIVRYHRGIPQESSF